MYFDQIEIGKRIKEIRKAKGLTDADGICRAVKYFTLAY